MTSKVGRYQFWLNYPFILRWTSEKLLSPTKHPPRELEKNVTFSCCRCRRLLAPSHACGAGSPTPTWPCTRGLDVRHHLFHSEGRSLQQQRCKHVCLCVCVCRSIPSLTEDVAREAFKSFASAQCCYSSGPANDGVITSMEPFNTYRVMSCSELRSVGDSLVFTDHLRQRLCRSRG